MWDTTRSLLNKHSARNNFHLAMHEFKDLDGPVDWDLLRCLGRRVAVIAAPKDMWFPKQHHDDMLSHIMDIEVSSCDTP